MILLFLQKDYLLRPFVSKYDAYPPARSDPKGRPSPSFLGLGFRLRSRCYSLNNIIIKINNNRRKTLFTAYALSAQDDSARVRYVRGVRFTARGVKCVLDGPLQAPHADDNFLNRANVTIAFP